MTKQNSSYGKKSDLATVLAIESKPYFWLALIVTSYLLIVVLINPIREFAFADDWAYSLMVRNLLETGRYQVHSWLAPNSPIQIYWGALFARSFGYSLASLHISTLTLALIGLVAFFFLAQEHGLPQIQSALLTLTLLVSPIALEFSFTFMSDVPFLACMCTAIYLYTVALRKESIWLMIAGSFAAAAAILTRQFGIALILGLAVTWLLGNNRRQSIALFAAGGLLPLLAGVWQIYNGIVTPNFAASLKSMDQIAFLKDVGILPFELVWRLVVVAIYMAVFALPLVVPTAAAIWQELSSYRRAPSPSPENTRRIRLFMGLLIAFMIVVGVIGVLMLKRPGVMPLIAWNFDVMATWPLPAISLLSFICLLGGVLITRIIVLRFVYGEWQRLPQYQRLLDVVTLFAVCVQLIYVQFGDEYLIHLMPYFLVVVGRAVSEHIQRLRWAVAALIVTVAAADIVWIQAVLGNLETQWRLADTLVESGRSPQEIYTQAWEWMSYQGAFDEFLLTQGPNYPPDIVARYFDKWLPARGSSAPYVIVPLFDGDDLSGWEVIERATYTDWYLQPVTIVSLRREE